MSKRNVKSMTLILFVILIVLVSLSCVSAQGVSDSSANLTKSQTDGSGGQVSVPSNNAILSSSGDKNFTVLQNEIDSSSTGMIQLSSNYTRAPGEDNIIISKNFNIFGNGNYKIDGNNLGGIFTINQGCSVLLSGVVLVNGNGTNGGAIYNEGTVNLINSKLTSNNASFGGAIYNKGIATVSGSTINENTATNQGGAVYSTGYLLVDNSNFENNKVTTGSTYAETQAGTCNGGGAIYNEGNLEVTKSTFTKNTAPHATEIFSAGGAIYNINTSDVFIDNCKFEENSAVYGGAVMFEQFSQDTVAVKDSVFNNNQAWQGGAINGNDLVGSLIVTGSNFTANKAVGPNAGQSSPIGGAFMIGTKSYTGIALDVSECNFVDNDGGYMGGAIASSPDNNIKVVDSNFTGNTATTLGGAIVTGTGTTLTVEGSTFTDNKVDTTNGMGGAIFCEPNSKNTITDSTFTGNVDRYPVAIMNYAGTIGLSGNTFDDNSVFNYGKITSTVKVTVLNNDTVITTDGTVTLNATVTDDNGNFIRDTSFNFVIGGKNIGATINVTNKIYTATYTIPAPGVYNVTAISTKGEEYIVKNGTVKNYRGSFTDLQARIEAAQNTLDLPYNFTYSAELDGASLADGILINKNLAINGNNSYIDGAGIARIFSIDTFATVNLKDIEFRNGNANYGGAIYAAGTLNVDNCTFINNTATIKGNAIYVPQEYTVYIIKDEESYNALLNDPTSALNKYYVVYPREDGIDADGNPVHDDTTPIVGHSWESAITANAANVPDGKTRFPWIVLNMDGFTGAIYVDYDGTQVFGPWNVADKMYGIISVPGSDDCNMPQYALNKSTGAATNEIDDSLFKVTIGTETYTTETPINNVVNIQNSKFIDNGAATDYAIYNEGKLRFTQNSVSNYIFNEGQFDSVVTGKVLNGTTPVYADSENVEIYATVTDDNGNLIDDPNFVFKIYDSNGLVKTVNAVFDGEKYVNTTVLAKGYYTVEMTNSKYATTIEDGKLTYIAGTYADLQMKIDAAIAAGEELNLTYDFAYDAAIDANFVNGVVINEEITINGNDHSIDGAKTARIFYVGTFADATIKGVVFKNGTADKGGALFVAGKLDIDNCTFIDNVATTSGSDIYIMTSSVVLVNGEESYNYLLNDPDSSLNKYYRDNPREDGIDANGNPVHDQTTPIVGHSWESAITTWMNPVIINGTTYKYEDGYSTFPWILINTNDFTGYIEFWYDGELKFNWTGNTNRERGVVSVLADLKMPDYSLLYQTGEVRNKTFDPSLLTVKYVGTTGGRPVSMISTTSDSVTIKNSVFNGDGNSIYNLGKLALENNTVKAIIYNNGTITSEVNSAVLNNKTVETAEYTYKLNATLTDDNGNKIYDPKLKFKVNDDEVAFTNYENGVYAYEYPIAFEPKYVVNVTTTNENKLNTKIGIIRNLKYGTYTDLQHYIDATNPSETLVLPYDFAYNAAVDGANFPYGVVINKEITIDGNGTTISGNGTHRIFMVNAATTLNNITFVNGSAIEFGGAIYTIADLTVANSTFDNNSVAQNDANGGAIMALAAADDVTLNIYNVTFTNNKVDNGGGAIGVAGVNGKTLTYNIYDSLFENNVANTTGTPNPASGGAIFSYGNAVGLINNTTFKGNEALTGDVSNGGAIKVQFGGTLTVANSTFINNKAGHAGGAISVQANTGMDNTLIVDNCTFFNNSAEEGAAIASAQYVGKSTITVKDSSFALNTADKGAAIYLDYLSDVKVENTKFMANKAINGAAIYALGDLELDNGTFVFNTAEEGGAIYASAEYANVNVDIDNSTFMLNVASDAGGAIAVFATGSHELAYNINDSRFIMNGAYNNASDACVAGGAFYSEGKTIGAISSSIFSNNIANSTLYPNGGAIKIQFGGTAIIKDCNFTKNSAGLSGGAIDVQAKNGANCEVTVQNCTFTNNTAQAGAAIASLQNHGNSTVIVTLSRFDNNDVELIGGAIYSDKYSDLSISSSNFTGNDGMFDDAIYNLGTLALDGNNVSNIIYSRGTIKTLVNATLNNNQTVTDKVLGEDVVLNATLTDDNGNAIFDPNFRITVDGNVIENITYDSANKLYTANYTIAHAGEIVVSTSYSSPNIVINTGIYDVPKSNATIIVTTGQNNVFAYDENVTVFIGLYDNKTWEGITDNITVVIDSTPRTVEVINGSASFNITGYEPGEHAIMGVFDGNNNYNGPVYNSTVFEVLYPNRILSIEAPVEIMEGEIALINITVTDNKGNKEKGTVVLNISGTEIVVIVDGNKSVEIEGLPHGIYTVNATLIEEGFNAAIVNDTESFTVIAKDDAIINITDIVINVGDAAVINASLHFSTAGENVTITVVGKGSKVVTIDENGTAVADFGVLPVGEYEIVVTYDGDRIWNAATANATLTVNKRTPVFNITDVNIKYREDANFTIQTDNPGYYTLSINGTVIGIVKVDDELNMTIHTTVAPGVYDVVLTVDESENYTAGTATATLTIGKQLTNLTIFNNGTEDDDVTYIGVFIKANGSYVYVTGNITIIVENETGIVLNITENITDDYYEYYDLGVFAPGKYNITAQFNGNDYYETSSADTIEYEVPKYVNYELPVTAENITYNQTEVITVILPNGTSKQDLLIDVNGTTYDGDDFIQEGNVVTLSIDGLNAGEYTVTAIFGDSVYDIKSNETVFTVAKANLTVAPKAIGEFVVDGKINVTFELPADVNASSVVVTVDGFHVIAELVNGTWVVPFDNLAAGDHIVTVSVVNDPNYNDATGEVMFTVSKVDPVITISDIAGIVGETVEVNVTIEGGDATGYIFYDGKLYVVENGNVAIPVVITTGGMQAIEVTYTGDDKYNNGTAVKEFNATKAASTTEINGTELITTVDDAIVLVTVGPEGATGAIVVALDEKIYDVYDIEDGIAIFTIPGLTAGNHSIVVKYTGDNNYNESVASMNVTVVVAPTFIDAEGKDAVYGESAYVFVSGLPEDATGNVTVTIGNKTFTEVVEYGIATVEITDLAAGYYELFAVSYSGDDKYNATSGMATVNITKARSSVLIYDIEDVIYGADVEVTFTIENETEITVTVIDADDNNITEGITITPGEVIISGLKAGEYSIYIYNAGDENHTNSSDLATFKVFKVTTKINITVTGDKVVDGEVNITFTVPEDITDGTVSVYIDGEEVVGFTIINGTCTIPATFAAGSHTVIISLSGDTNYEDTASSETFEIAKADSEASINATGVLPYGSDAIINVTLPEDATGVVVAEINGELYASYVENGTATIIIPDLVEGNYTATVTYYGDDKYQSVNTTLDIEVVNGLLIIAPDVFKYYHGPERFVIYTTDYAGNPIDGIDLQITINGVTYNRSSNNGKTSLPLNLESGNYTVNVVFNGNSDYEAQNVTSQVEIESTIYAENVVKVFKNGTQYYALFLDSEGNPLANTQVTFNINGVFYNRTTNATGWAKLNINLEAGEYVLTATNPVTGESKGTNVTVLSQFAEHSALVKNYGDPTPYVVKIRAKDGSIAGAGEVVTFNINGVLYNRTTNASGEAKLNINLQPGEFIITSTYNGESTSDIITIKPAN